MTNPGPTPAPGVPGDPDAALVAAAMTAALTGHPEIGVAVATLEGRILQHNAVFAALLGRGGEDLCGVLYQSFADPTFAGDLVASMETVSSGQRQQGSGERRFLRPDGTGVWLRTTGSLVRDDDGRPSFTVGVVQDVTDRRLTLERAEEEVAQRRLTEDQRRHAEEEHQLLMDVSPAAVVIHRRGVVEYANAAALALFGASTPADVVGRLMFPPTEDALDPAAEPGGAVPMVRVDGQSIDVLPVVTPRLWRGQPALQVTLQDVTAVRRAAEELAARERFHSEVLDSMAAQALVLDGEGRVLSYNRAWELNLHRMGDSRATPVGTDFIAICRASTSAIARTVAPLADGLERVLRGEAHEFAMDLEVRYPDESVAWYTLHALPLTSLSGGLVVNLTDVTELKKYELELSRQAMHDALTGLPNRVLLHDRLDRAMRAQGRRHTSVGVLFIDIDHFKLVNDSYGHAAGDSVLMDVADRLTAAVRPSDTVTRFAGDEFVIVAEDLTDEEEVAALAERVLVAIRGFYAVPGGQLQVSASIGVAISSGSMTAGDLLRDADTALFEAKATGRDCAVAFDHALSGRARERLLATQDLRRAIERTELELHFQPLLDLRTGRVDTAEALLRWHRPGHGLLSPSQFIPLAEESGLITQIGLWVITEAVTWAAAHPGDEHTPPMSVAVNVAARQFTSPDFVDTVRDSLAGAGLRPDLLTLEITETTLMADPMVSGSVLDKLKALGVRLSVDDFGTGYSSLAYLQRFPVDELKIDRSFVDGIVDDVADHAIVSAIIGLAHAMGLSLVAEGIESAEQLSRVRELGCQRAQGYLIARPQLAGALEDWLRTAR